MKVRKFVIPVMVKLTEEQAEYLDLRVAETSSSRGEYLRDLLEADFMQWMNDGLDELSGDNLDGVISLAQDLAMDDPGYMKFQEEE